MACFAMHTAEPEADSDAGDDFTLSEPRGEVTHWTGRTGRAMAKAAEISLRSVQL